MKPTLLCYNLQGERARQIKLCAMRLRIFIREVRPAEYGWPLAALCGLESEAADAASAEAFEDEMLLLAGFADALANQFLQSLRRAKIAPVALKAVLTATNKDWNSCKLREELAQERAALASGGAPAHQDPVEPR